MWGGLGSHPLRMTASSVPTASVRPLWPQDGNPHSVLPQHPLVQHPYPLRQPLWRPRAPSRTVLVGAVEPPQRAQHSTPIKSDATPHPTQCCWTRPRIPPPPLVVPHPLSFPRGGVGDRHVLNPQFFGAAHCVVVANHHPRVLPKAFQWKVVSMCTSSRSSGAGPRKFTPSWSRSRSPYIGSPLNTSYAEFFCFMLQFLCLQTCVYGGSAVPQGGVGDRHLVTVPQGGGWGTVTW